MAEFTLPHARPYGFTFPVAKTALLIIDMQRDFLDPNGFGAEQCGNAEIFASVRKIVPVVQRVLGRCRDLGMQVIHTREGHRADLLDLPAAKRLRQISAPGGHHSIGIGDVGPMGRLLVRGEFGHDIIDELRARPGEAVIDKPGKGSFWGTGLHRELLARGVTHLLVAGVTTECCVTTTIRECNDRGYECCLLSDCTDGFDAQMVTTAMDTICAQDGLFGYVGDSSDFLSQTENYTQRDLSPQKKDLLSIAHLVRRYHRGLEEPVRIVNMIYDRIDNYKEGDFEGWTCLQSRETVIADAEALSVRYKDKHCLPTLFGVPFAVQDAFDVAGIPTAAGAQGHSYTPTTTAPAVQALLDAGAIFVGKLNSEMLKTGVFDLPAPHDTSSSAHALEGSSAHSTGPAAAVSAGLVSFILRTDTTGESLPPCRSNGVVTLKTTKGTIPTQGVVSISPSLDTISITAQSVEDARTVWLELQKCDNSTEPYVKPFASLPTWHVDSRDTSSWKSRFRFAVSPGFLGDTACSPKHAKLLGETVKSLESCGGRRVEIDYEPFETASKLLVPNDTAAPNLLVLEHIATIGTDTIERNLATMHLGQQEIYKHQLSASTFKPWEIFQSQARLAECARKAQTLFDPLNLAGLDMLVVPSPVNGGGDSELATLTARARMFTQAINALDLCAVTVSAGSVKESDAETSLPLGVTFVGGMGYDAKVLDLARDFVGTSDGSRKA